MYINLAPASLVDEPWARRRMCLLALHTQFAPFSFPSFRKWRNHKRLVVEHHICRRKLIKLFGGSRARPMNMAKVMMFLLRACNINVLVDNFLFVYDAFTLFPVLALTVCAGKSVWTLALPCELDRFPANLDWRCNRRWKCHQYRVRQSPWPAIVCKRYDIYQR